MTTAGSTMPFIQSPLGVTLVGVICVTMVTLAGAALKIVIQLARMELSIKGMREDITALKTDPDVMRWSNYGRVMQSSIVQRNNPGV